jgi:hypothetical protein
MAISPSLTISGGRVSITASPGQAPDFLNEGIGYMNNGSLAIDTNAVAGSNSINGFAQNSTGALYGTTVTAGSDEYQAGARRSTAGALVYVVGAATQYGNGNPQDANGALACI